MRARKVFFFTFCFTFWLPTKWCLIHWTEFFLWWRPMSYIFYFAFLPPLTMRRRAKEVYQYAQGTKGNRCRQICQTVDHFRWTFFFSDRHLSKMGRHLLILVNTDQLGGEIESKGGDIGLFVHLSARVNSSFNPPLCEETVNIFSV